jgi:hypothetical protein
VHADFQFLPCSTSLSGAVYPRPFFMSHEKKAGLSPGSFFSTGSARDLAEFA